MVVAFLDVVFFVENDCCPTFICWKDSDFFVFFQRVKSLSLLFERLSSGGDAFWSTRLALALMLSASAIGRFFTTVSALATMSFGGIFFGVTEKFKPFSRTSFSWGDNVLVERLTTIWICQL